MILIPATLAKAIMVASILVVNVPGEVTKTTCTGDRGSLECAGKAHVSLPTTVFKK